MEQNGQRLLIAAGTVTVLLVGGAHFWRAGDPGLAGSCGGLALLACTRQAWIRAVLRILLPLLAARWLLATGQLVQMRMLFEQPWGRLGIILGTVAAATAGMALLLGSGAARGIYQNGAETAGMQSAVFLITSGLLAAVHFSAPDLPVLNRFAPGWGLIQAFIPGVWGAWLSGRLADRRTAIKARLLAWKIFSLVFFAQLILGLAGSSLFLMTGQLHLPVPALIAGGPLYRGEGFFMPVLFCISTLLVGAAWCSQLCYFGVWDAGYAAFHPKTVRGSLPRVLKYGRLIMLGLVVSVPFVLRLTGAPVSVALSGGLLAGLLLIPAAWLISRRYGIAAYCLGICPMGLLANLIGKLSPWRIRRTAACTQCLACTHVCRYQALPREALRAGRPLDTCTLCRDCVNTCKHGGLTMGLRHTRITGTHVERGFIALLTILHSLFLGIARV